MMILAWRKLILFAIFVCWMSPPFQFVICQQSLPEFAAETPSVGAAFIPNVGQWDDRVLYVARIGPAVVQIEERGWLISVLERCTSVGLVSSSLKSPDRLFPDDGASAPGGAAPKGVALRFRFSNPEPNLRFIPQGPRPGVFNFYVKSDAGRWKNNVPSYDRILLQGVYPGIDVLLRDFDGRLEYDLLLAPGADLSLVELVVEGGEGLAVDEDGSLIVMTALGPMIQPLPKTWQEDLAGNTDPVVCSYVLLCKDRYGFVAPCWDPSMHLVVDPGLVWSTYLGGSNEDVASDVAVDASGSSTVVGTTGSLDLPTTPGVFQGAYGGGLKDAFVTRLAPDGRTLFWSTYLGGGSWDLAHGVVLDASGAAIVVGGTSSSDFPTTAGALQTRHGGGYDGFVVRLCPNGTLVWSTFLGGNGRDEVNAIAIDATNTLILGGFTTSPDFPVTASAFQGVHGGELDGFVTRISPGGSSLIFSTYLGGDSLDEVKGVAVGPGGDIFAAGWTASSTTFPTTSSGFQTLFGGGASDAFAARLSPSGDRLIWSTFLGGGEMDTAFGIAVDPSGVATVGGTTRSLNFPVTSGSFQQNYNSQYFSGFIARIASAGDRLLWSTYFSSNRDIRILDVALDSNGAATVVGQTRSYRIPTTSGAFMETWQTHPHTLPKSLGFIARIAPAGDILWYCSYVNGISENLLSGVAVDAQGVATMVGWTQAPDYPTSSGAFQRNLIGAVDAVVTRLDMLPTGVWLHGRSTPGCDGPLSIGVTSIPRLGNPVFAVTCGNAPPLTTGFLVLGIQPVLAPIAALGIDLWIDPAPFFHAFSSVSDGIGASVLPLPLPLVPYCPVIAALRIYTQWIWVGPNSPVPCPPLGLSASAALRISIQP